MPIISGGGGGGAAFNGGTITNRLTINGATILGEMLKLIVTGLSNWEVEVEKIDNGGGTIDALLALRGDGAGRGYLNLRNGSGDSTAHVGSDQITLDSNSAISSDTLLEVSSAFAGTLFEVFSGNSFVGAPMLFAAPPTLQNHAAPADGTLGNGDCALWFDQTSGVGNTKLMLKAKASDGTVKTASILLA